jgi:DNA-directed RNA polymerase specialized sigma24 family protein
VTRLTDRELVALAKETLTEEEFKVWFGKTYRGLGRRAGAAALRISEEQWRYRLGRAKVRLDEALDRKDAA